MLKKFCFYLTVVLLLTTTVFYTKNNPKPKNIILLIGDGMGLSQVSISSLYLQNDQFKKFLTIGLINTCSADKLITDSAAGATAYATGYQTKNGMISVDENGKSLKTIVELAKQKKKSAGVVVTCSVTNATPAVFLSHNKTRKDEFGIARQILNSNVDVILGSGNDFFLPKALGGKREDDQNLVDSMKFRGYEFISNPEQLFGKAPTKKFFGLFGSTSLPHATEREYSLGLLTQKAIENLSKNKKGFFLMIEGSQIDWAAEQNDNDYLLGELKDFNSAIETALKFAENDKNTLVIVLADHDTGSLGISGNSKQTNRIEVVWASKKHTANFVGAFSYGPGSNLFGGFQDNYEVGKKLMELIQ